MNNEKAASSISESVMKQIKELVDMNLTVYGTNVSALLQSQRDRIGELQSMLKETEAKANELAKLMLILSGGIATEGAGPSIRMAGLVAEQYEPAEDEGEEGNDSGINVEIKVTGSGDVPPELVAVLNNLSAMLKSIGK